MAVESGNRLGPYEVLGEIGAGAFKTVLRARNAGGAEAPEEVALGVPHRQDLESALQHSSEFELMRHLRHPNIVRVYETRFIEDEETYFVVMELVSGCGLNELLAREGCLPAEMVARIGAEVASGLAHAHSMHVIHRDIKPGNILVTDDGTAKVADFGIARLVASTSGQAESLVGTIDYMAPEQFSGTTGRQADVWALGVTLYEALTGEHPFRGENSAETMHRIQAGRVPPPGERVPGAPRDLCAVIVRALERDLTRRYQTAEEFGDALRECLRGARFEAPEERQLFEYLRASYSVLYLTGYEEARMAKCIRRAASQVSDRLRVWDWTVSEGLVDAVGRPVNGGMNNPQELLRYILDEGAAGVYVLRDMHHFLGDSVTQRLMREASDRLGRAGKTAIITAPGLALPVELEKALTVVHFGPPGEEELDACLQRVIDQVPADATVELSAEERSVLVRSALGLTGIEAENAFVRAVIEDGDLDGESYKRVLSQKQQLVARSGVLEFVWPEGGMEQVGGLDALKHWFAQRSRAFSLRAREFGLPVPKGVLLAGVPGCGKSLSAKAVAAAWGKPLLRLDLGRIMQPAVGSSEANLRNAIATAESIAPCVLWIDEIEKAFAGSGSQQGSGVSARLLGFFLSWLQDKSSPVFVVATANSIEALPPELLRKGRFDDIFFVDLPDEAERGEIAAVHLNRLARSPDDVDLASVVDATEGFSGAEIEKVCVDALYRAFFAEEQLSTAHLVEAAGDTRPLSEMRTEDIEALRAWGRANARSAG